MRRLSSLAITLFSGAAAMAQPVFTNASAALTNNASSGGCMAVVDMDDDGLDDIVQLDMSTHVHVLYQNPDHTFTHFDYGQIDTGAQWGWAIADIDNNGHKDVLSGVSLTNYLRITSRGVSTLTDLNGPSIFTQGMTIGDFNNDGKVDVYACNDVGPNNIWITNSSGVPVYDANFINWATACTGTSGDMSGNYGSTMADFDGDGDRDLHISHCRQGVNDPNDCRRWDRMFVNDGTGHYTDLAADYGLENHEQVWTTDFGDYDNDGDLDAFSTTHSSTLMLFENDGTGHFTNVTAGSGLEVAGFFLQGLLRDFDNDGYLDALTASTHFYFKGHGDGTFTQVNNVFPAAKTMHSFATGDLNGDGFIDVYAGYGDNYVDGDDTFADRLWLNTPNGNHWFQVRLRGVQSNRDAVGARVTITGPWGTQVREVRSGESYGMVNSFVLTFGLGAATEVTSMSIHWPSGLDETFNNLGADQEVMVIEGTCISPESTIASSNGNILCTGGAPLTLSADAGFSYQWSTGASSQSIQVNGPGNYGVALTDGSGCVGHATTTIVLDPDQTPTITVDGPTTICSSDQVTLTSSDASGYTWSNSANDQSITVNTAGTYTVTVDGACAEFTSDPVEIDVLPAPVAPGSGDVAIPAPGTADLEAVGDSIVWFDAAVDGNVMGTGDTWTTPFLNGNTSFWAGDVNTFGGDSLHGGRLAQSTSGQNQSSNTYYLLFDAYEPFTIESVKVYANGAANRTIAVVNYNGGAVIATGSFFVPNGESRVQLNFNVPAGGPYGLRVTSNNPQLWRDGPPNGNPVFPYALGTLGAITGTTASGSPLSYYYFFYDWKVKSASTYCAGPRTEVHVTVGATGVDALSDASGMNVYPVPTSDLLNVEFGTITGAVRMDLFDVTGRVVSSERGTADSRMTMDLAGIAPGEYSLRVNHDTGVVVRRVVVR